MTTKSNKIFSGAAYIEINSRYYLGRIDVEMFILIILAGLYQNKTITIEKLKGQLSSLRKGDLLKLKKTYHCTINDRWYSEENASYIFNDLINFNNVSYVKLIEVLQLYTNKNYNYCIDLVVGRIIEPYLNHFTDSQYDYLSDVFKTNLSDFPTIQEKGYRSECDCCGHSTFERDYRQTKEEGLKQITDFFHQFKRGNLSKIPKTGEVAAKNALNFSKTGHI